MENVILLAFLLQIFCQRKSTLSVFQKGSECTACYECANVRNGAEKVHAVWTASHSSVTFSELLRTKGNKWKDKSLRGCFSRKILTGQFGENSDAALLTAFAGISSKVRARETQKSLWISNITTDEGLNAKITLYSRKKRKQSVDYLVTKGSTKVFVRQGER